MPRVKVVDPSAAAKAHPREFAILAQLAHGQDGFNVSSEALKDTAKQLGNADSAAAAASKDELDFGLWADIFKKMSEVVEGEGNCVGWAARDTTGVLSPWRFDRRATRPDDVVIQITHAGVCHSDLHSVRNEWANAKYPLVPGHEILGIVIEVGSDVTKFKVGDLAGVGCMVDACFECSSCTRDLAQYCKKGCVQTYNWIDYEGNMMYGGYSTHIVVRDKAVFKVPGNLPMAAAAPLMCAGITVYSPLRYYGLDKPGMKVGVVGLGGLGHMAVKFLKAFGCDVTVISRSKSKEAEAKALGADHYLVSSDEEAMKAAARSLDGVVDSVSAEHDQQAIVNLLDSSGKLVVLGAPPKPIIPVSQMSLIMNRITIGGSLIGGFDQTQEMLDFCGENGVVCDVEVIDIDYINTAMDRLQKGDVKFRFVIDVQKSLVLP